MATGKAVGGKAKLPVRQLAILAACRFAEPLAYTSVFPYLPEMIESFGVDQMNVAKWAGLTSAAFSLAQSVTAIGWGRASDHFGRKPMVVLALFSTMTTILMWGFSMDLPWAMVARAATGACNGNVGIMRTMVAEMVPEKELQPAAFSVLPLVWAVGSTIGPAFGGFFAKPAENFSNLFGNNKFFLKFPFALPNLVSAGFFAISMTIAVLFLRETLETHKSRPDYGLVLGKKISRIFRRKPRKSRKESDMIDESTGLLSAASEGSESSTGLDEAWSPDDAKASESARPPSTTLKEIFTPQTNIALITYCFLALHSIAYDQLLPVFLHHPVQEPDHYSLRLPWKFSGGFGLGSGRIGTLFTIFGIVGGFIQFLIFPPVARRYGVLNCYKVCTMTFPIVYLLTPFPAIIQNPLAQQVVILGIMVIKSFCVVFAFPCVTILLTNSAPSLRVLGTVNGFATSLSAIGRATGPAVCGFLFTWGVAHDFVILPWWTLALIAAVGIIPAWRIKESDGFVPEDDVEDHEREGQESLLPVIDSDDDDDSIVAGNARDTDLDPQGAGPPQASQKEAQAKTQFP